MLNGNELAQVVAPGGANTAAYMEKGKKFVGNALTFAYPLVAEEAKGAVIRDVDGNTYLDFYAGIGVLNLGHCPDEVVAAIREQAGKAIHTMINFCINKPYIDMCETLTSIAPFGEPMKVVFANSGSEAVENAIKVAKANTKRTGVVSFTNCFHGRTLLTSSITHKIHPFKAGLGPLAPETYHLPGAYYYRYGNGMTEEQYINYLLSEIDFMLDTEIDGENIAAMIIEPIQGEGGILVQPPAFLQGLKKLCEKYGIIFIADEVQAGFCRSGKYFSIEHGGFAPDLMSLAKSIASGMPLSAVMGKTAIMDKALSGQLGGTFGGNPVACVAGIATIDAYKRLDLCSRANELGAYMKGRLAEMQKAHPQIGDIRGLGAMIGIELVKDPVTKEPDKDAVNKIIVECRNNGLILINSCIRGNGIRFLPPLVVTDAQMAQAMDILAAACDKVLE